MKMGTMANKFLVGNVVHGCGLCLPSLPLWDRGKVQIVPSQTTTHGRQRQSLRPPRLSLTKSPLFGLHRVAQECVAYVQLYSPDGQELLVTLHLPILLILYPL